MCLECSGQHRGEGSREIGANEEVMSTDNASGFCSSGLGVHISLALGSKKSSDAHDHSRSFSPTFWLLQFRPLHYHGQVVRGANAQDEGTLLVVSHSLADCCFHLTTIFFLSCRLARWKRPIHDVYERVRSQGRLCQRDEHNGKVQHMGRCSVS
jgi:hypothetical protein